MKIITSSLLGLVLGLLPSLGHAQVGDPAPNFTVIDTHGDTLTLYELIDSGHTVVLDFFYTTCGPCQYYSPQVNLAYEKYGCNTAKTFFMSIDYNDTNAEVEAYDEQYKIEFPSVSGLNGGGNGVVNLYGIQGFPTFYVIDATKKIIDQITPPTLQVFNFRFQQLGILPADCLSGGHEPGTQEPLSLYPNPVSAGGEINIQLPGIESGMARYEILNILGQSLQTGAWNLGTPLPIGMVGTGLYLLKISGLKGEIAYSAVFAIE